MSTKVTPVQTIEGVEVVSNQRQINIFTWKAERSSKIAKTLAAVRKAFAAERQLAEKDPNHDELATTLTFMGVALENGDQFLEVNGTSIPKGTQISEGGVRRAIKPGDFIVAEDTYRVSGSFHNSDGAGVYAFVDTVPEEILKGLIAAKQNRSNKAQAQQSGQLPASGNAITR